MAPVTAGGATAHHAHVALCSPGNVPADPPAYNRCRIVCQFANAPCLSSCCLSRLGPRRGLPELSALAGTDRSTSALALASATATTSRNIFQRIRFALSPSFLLLAASASVSCPPARPQRLALDTVAYHRPAYRPSPHRVTRPQSTSPV